MNGRPPSLNGVLPHGFRFNPYDRELLDYYRAWVRGEQLPCDDIIVGAEVYSTEPWNLISDNEEEEDEKVGYFFSHRTLQHRYSTYMSRRVGSGAWYPEKKHPIKAKGKVIGYKQMLCYYLFQEDTIGSTRKRKKIKKSTGWVMYEYELPPGSTNIPRQQREPILCLIRKTAQAISSSRKKYQETVETANTPLPVNTAIQTSNFSYHLEVSDTKPILGYPSSFVVREESNTGCSMRTSALPPIGIAPSSSFVVREESNTGCSMRTSALPPIGIAPSSSFVVREESNTGCSMRTSALPPIGIAPSSSFVVREESNTGCSMRTSALPPIGIAPSSSFVVREESNTGCSMRTSALPPIGIAPSSSFVVREESNTGCSMRTSALPPIGIAPSSSFVVREEYNTGCTLEQGNTIYKYDAPMEPACPSSTPTAWKSCEEPPDEDIAADKLGSSWNPTNPEAESSGGGNGPLIIDPFEWYTRNDPTDW